MECLESKLESLLPAEPGATKKANFHGWMLHSGMLRHHDTSRRT